MSDDSDSSILSMHCHSANDAMSEIDKEYYFLDAPAAGLAISPQNPSSRRHCLLLQASSQDVIFTKKAVRSTLVLRSDSHRPNSTSLRDEDCACSIATEPRRHINFVSNESTTSLDSFFPENKSQRPRMLLLDQDLFDDLGETLRTVGLGDELEEHPADLGQRKHRFLSFLRNESPNAELSDENNVVGFWEGLLQSQSPKEQVKRYAEISKGNLNRGKVPLKVMLKELFQTEDPQQ